MKEKALGCIILALFYGGLCMKEINNGYISYYTDCISIICWIMENFVNTIKISRSIFELWEK